MKQSKVKLVAGLGALALASPVLAACAGGGSGSGGGDGAVEVLMSVDPLVFEGIKTKIEERAQAEGVEVDVQRVDNINQIIMTRIDAGDEPDIAMIPQPGVVKDIVDQGVAQPLDDVLDMDALDQSMTPGTLDAGTFDDQLYGLMVSMNVKSLVFYPKKAWDQAGFQAPESLDELQALTEQIKTEAGTTPWCFGIESEAATGWPATDWIEDLVMRYGGTDGYQQWVSNEIPFNDDIVVQSGQYLEDTVLQEGNVAGGPESVASTNFGAADDPMWEAEPGCYLLKQGNFIVSQDFMPQNVVDNVDQEIGVFGFPPAEAGGENPVLGGGDLAVLLSESEDAATVMNIMAEVELGEQAAPNSSFISPHTTFDKSLYPSDLTRQIADVAYQSDAVLFDGSDQMPGAVGAGSFWKEMTAWIAGDEDLETALQNIEDSWPAS